MQIRKFKAKNVKEAIQMVKREMGSDAIILSMHSVRGVTGGTLLEVTASIDREAGVAKGTIVNAKVVDNNGSPVSGNGNGNGASSKTGSDNMLENLFNEIKFIKRRLETIEENVQADSVKKQFETGFNDIQRTVSELLIAHDRKAAAADIQPFESELGELYRKLLSTGVDERFAQSLVGHANEKLTERKLSPSIYGMEYLAGALMDQVRIADPFRKSSGQQVHMIVGPTGVGKTTTIAKLAAHQVFEMNRSVALLTVDTFRIGAIDQLRTYARILDVPLEVCMRDVELVEAVRKHVDKDVLFVDTAGSSQKDAAMIGELAKIHRTGVPMDVHLIVSATTAESDLLDINDRYGVMPLASIIVSKLDEANCFGKVYNLMQQTKVPYSYFTVGQNVPDDIEAATPERVADLLLSISAQ